MYCRGSEDGGPYTSRFAYAPSKENAASRRGYNDFECKEVTATAGDSMLMSVPWAMRAKMANGNVHLMHRDAKLNGCVWSLVSLEVSTVPVACSVGPRPARMGKCTSWMIRDQRVMDVIVVTQSVIFIFPDSIIPIHFCLACPLCSAR